MWNQLCVVIMCTMFGLYITKLKATVTLTFNGIISKSIGVIYNWKCLCQIEEPGSILFDVYVNMLTVTVTLNFHRLTLKSIWTIYTPRRMFVPYLRNTRAFLCVVIIRTRFGLYVNMLTVTVTLTFDRLTSKSMGIIYTRRCMSVPNLTNLGQFCV